MADTPADAWPVEARSAGPPGAADETPEGAPRMLRRVGFRKGAEVDEELWPAEAFGGVTDEQFWDDLASDKPLTTTARVAQQDSGAPNSRAPRYLPSGDERSAGRAGYAATQSARSAASQVPAAAQAAPAAIAVPEPLAPAGQPGDRGGRRRRSSRAEEEDPLTSAAFALRPSGPVDGRSAPMSSRPRDPSGEPYAEPRPAGSLAGGYGATAPYLYAAPSYADTSSAQSPGPGSGADDPRGHDGARGQARPGGDGNRDRDYGPRQPYPQDGRQGNEYRAGGYPPSGSHGSGYPPNGHRAPYDPREDYRRLPQLSLPRAD